jgi:osmotically inducible protein OsmC
MKEITMATRIDKVLYRAHATSTGGRDGVTRSSDGLLDVKLAVPKEMGGPGGGVNPEQLFASGYSACFLGAMKFIAGMQKVALPADTSIRATVGIGQIPAGFGIEVQMVVTVPGVDRAVAQAIVNKAHEVCPYSNATRGNIEVTITLA